jgi:hypothetical protein
MTSRVEKCAPDARRFSTASAELLLGRMHAKIDDLCAERDRRKREQGAPTKGRVLGGRSW